MQTSISSVPLRSGSHCFEPMFRARPQLTSPPLARTAVKPFGASAQTLNKQEARLNCVDFATFLCFAKRERCRKQYFDNEFGALASKHNSSLVGGITPRFYGKRCQLLTQPRKLVHI